MSGFSAVSCHMKVGLKQLETLDYRVVKTALSHIRLPLLNTSI